MSVALKSHPATVTPENHTAELRFQPLTPAIGAEVTGVDLRHELDAGTVAAIRHGLLKHKVLFFRDQPISDAQQVRFTRYFGAVTPGHPIANGLREQPEIYPRNLNASRNEYRQTGPTLDHPLRAFRRAHAGRGWHIDITFVANPAAISVLRGVEIPVTGGDTLFVNLEALYAGLSEPLRTFIDGLKAIHLRDDAANGRPPAPRFDGREPGPFASLHPLVRVHPETGKKVLFLSGFVQAIEGLRGSESDALLTFLSQELTNRQDLQARYRWTKDSIAVWDNRAVAHAGPIDGALIEGERIVNRTTVGGDLPVGPDGFVSRPLVGELFNTIS